MNKSPIALRETTIHNCIASDNFFRWAGVSTSLFDGNTVDSKTNDHSRWRIATPLTGVGVGLFDGYISVPKDGYIYYDHAPLTGYVAMAEVFYGSNDNAHNKGGGIAFGIDPENKANYYSARITPSGRLIVKRHGYSGTAIIFTSDHPIGTLRNCWNVIAARVATPSSFHIYLNGELIFSLDSNAGLPVGGTQSGIVGTDHTDASNVLVTNFMVFTYGIEYGDWVGANLSVRNATDDTPTNMIPIPGRHGGILQTGRPLGRVWNFEGVLFGNMDSTSGSQNLISQPFGINPSGRDRPGYSSSTPKFQRIGFEEYIRRRQGIPMAIISPGLWTTGIISNVGYPTYAPKTLGKIANFTFKLNEYSFNGVDE